VNPGSASSHCPNCAAGDRWETGDIANADYSQILPGSLRETDLIWGPVQPLGALGQILPFSSQRLG
jgi:hypothetical protein